MNTAKRRNTHGMQTVGRPIAFACLLCFMMLLLLPDTLAVSHFSHGNHHAEHAGLSSEPHMFRQGEPSSAAHGHCEHQLSNAPHAQGAHPANGEANSHGAVDSCTICALLHEIENLFKQLRAAGGGALSETMPLYAAVALAFTGPSALGPGSPVDARVRMNR